MTSSDRDRTLRIIPLVTGGLTVAAIAATGAATTLAARHTERVNARARQISAEAAGGVRATQPAATVTIPPDGAVARQPVEAPTTPLTPTPTPTTPTVATAKAATGSARRTSPPATGTPAYRALPRQLATATGPAAPTRAAPTGPATPPPAPKPVSTAPRNTPRPTVTSSAS